MSYYKIIQQQPTQILKEFLINHSNDFIKITRFGKVERDYSAHIQLYVELMGLINRDQRNITEFKEYSGMAVPVPLANINAFLILQIEYELRERQNAQKNNELEDCLN